MILNVLLELKIQDTVRFFMIIENKRGQESSNALTHAMWKWTHKSMHQHTR